MSKNIQATVRIVSMPMLSKICEQLHLRFDICEDGKTRDYEMFSRKLPGIASFNLDAWTYPCVVTDQQGTLQYDNYEGSWGDKKELDAFLSAYSEGLARETHERLGNSLHDYRELEDGSKVLEFAIA